MSWLVHPRIVMESTQTKEANQFRVSKSLELNEDLVKRALGTFSMSNPFKSLRNREQYKYQA